MTWNLDEWHAAPLSPVCDWAIHAAMPAHPRTHD